MFSKKKNELKKANKPGNSRAVEKAEQGFKVTATGLEPRTTQFLNEHSTIWPNIWPFGQTGRVFV